MAAQSNTFPITLLFLLEIDANEHNLRATLTPLNPSDRSVVDSPIYLQSVPIRADGHFEIEIEEMTLPPELSLLGDQEMKISLELHGELLHEEPGICGTFDAHVIELDLFLNGTFGTNDPEGEPITSCP